MCGVEDDVLGGRGVCAVPETPHRRQYVSTTDAKYTERLGTTCSGVTKGWGRTAPGDNRPKINFFVAEFRKKHWKNDVGRWEW